MIPYIKKLKQQLSALNTQDRKRILSEIEAVIKAENLTEEQIVERFGSAQQLAQNYLEDTPTKSKPSRKTLVVGILLGLAGLITIGLLVGYSIYRYAISDDFDYADYDGDSIAIKAADYPSWQPFTATHIEINQAKVGLYRNTTGDNKYSCKSNDTQMVDNTLSIRQNKCLLVVSQLIYPQLEVRQSEVILIHPQSLEITLDQSSLRLKLKEKTNLSLSGSQFEVDKNLLKNLNQAQNQLTIKAYQSEIIDYQYR